MAPTRSSGLRFCSPFWGWLQTIQQDPTKIQHIGYTMISEYMSWYHCGRQYWNTLIHVYVYIYICIYTHTHKDSSYFATENYASSWVGITMVTLRFRRVLRLRRCWPLLVVTALAASQSFVEPIKPQAEAEETDANLTKKHGDFFTWFHH